MMIHSIVAWVLAPIDLRQGEWAALVGAFITHVSALYLRIRRIERRLREHRIRV